MKRKKNGYARRAADLAAVFTRRLLAPVVSLSGHLQHAGFSFAGNLLRPVAGKGSSGFPPVFAAGCSARRRSVKGWLAVWLLWSICLAARAEKQFVLKAPAGKLAVEITAGPEVTYRLLHEGDVLIERGALSLTLDGGETGGDGARLAGTTGRQVDETIAAPFYKKASVRNRYRELTLRFRGGYRIVFRAYDNGMAYRFETLQGKPLRVLDELAEFRFPGDPFLYVPYVARHTDNLESQFFNAFENTYTYGKLSEWNPQQLAFGPVLAEGAGGKKLAITEADLLNYPGMYFYNGDRSAVLRGVFPRRPARVKQGGHNRLQGIVESREEAIAAFDGPASFPWRVVIVAATDRELLDNDLVYCLASPADGDFSWVKPGKAAWEWWHDWNLYGVDFRAGINTATYKYYIDFAAAYGLEYVLLDEGWTVRGEADLFRITPGLDLEELADYAASKGVGILLWAGYWAIARDMERVCAHYARMGIKGFKVDFMDRDDQPMVDFHVQLARTAARYRLVLDFHGTYKPTGLQRTFPNVLNFEGVYGLENRKVAATDQVTYDVTVPFIRMLAGPMDYTQGAMRNAAGQNYRPVYSEPMSQGTRCRQLAQYVIFESPLAMLCDSPSAYYRESVCTEFIARMPVVWDETAAFDGKIGQYAVIGRRKGNEWYVGAITGWEGRRLELDLSFLGEGSFRAEIFKDGINADRAACDYKREVLDVPSCRKMRIDMAPGGGYVMRIWREK